MAVADANGGLARAKSQLTMMLAENPETKRFEEVFAAVPRTPGGESESVPLKSLTAPKGLDVWININMIVLVNLVLWYCLSVGFTLVGSFLIMAGGSCGQDVWKTTPQEACNKLMEHLLAFGIELRCFGELPAGLDPQACGSGMWMGIIGSLLAGVPAVMGAVKSIGELPSKVHFHPTLLVVESWNGKSFECCFYADMASAKVTSWAIDISTRAKVKLMAGGADGSKKGTTLKVLGKSSLKILTANGAAQAGFNQELGTHLPVSIEGLGRETANAVVDQLQLDRAATIFQGPFDAIAKARACVNGSGEEVTYEAARKPISADFVAELFIILCIMGGIWYVFATFSTFVGWAFKKGMGHCYDPMKPDVDVCAIWRIFVPLSVPFVNPSDYINVVVLACAFIVVPLWLVVEMPIEQRFYSNGIVQELKVADLEYQFNTMAFADDIETLEHVDGSLEKYLKMHVKSSYSIKGGLKKPIDVTATFMPVDVKFTLADEGCAACSGHGQRAKEHREKLLQLADLLKPGLLNPGSVTSEDEAPFVVQASKLGQPEQVDMPCSMP
eukprot:TRINITY_DN23126_c0_g1_i2.p1 TRINITY_DN23126_c0_g1~~TRINITY_DN23126_c0_g1_i2.p1  ORF type:complete len:557 (+),score=106.31 TRINITY_DN23126_c0_g1_i2:94-1764(+)